MADSYIGGTGPSLVFGEGGGSGGTPGPNTIQRITAMDAESYADQMPAGTEFILGVSFGPAQINQYLDLTEDGFITCITPGTYHFRVRLRVSRDIEPGVVTDPNALLFRSVVDNVQLGPTQGVYMEGTSSTIPLEFTFWAVLQENQTISCEIRRDPGFSNDGGLLAMVPTDPSWNPIPSADLLIEYWPQVG